MNPVAPVTKTRILFFLLCCSVFLSLGRAALTPGAASNKTEIISEYIDNRRYPPDATIQRLIGLVRRAVRSGDIRSGLEPFDLLRALIDISHVPSGPGRRQSARRLVDILIAGSRPVR